MPWDLCITCRKKGCHSSNHRERGKQLFHKYARAYLAGEHSDEGRFNDDTQTDTEDDGSEQESEAYMSSVHFTALMDLSPEETKFVVDAIFRTLDLQIYPLSGWSYF